MPVAGWPACRAVLRDLRLRLRTVPPVVYDVISGVPWLGVRLRPRAVTCGGRMTFGFVVPQAKIDDMLCGLAEMTTPPKNRLDQRAFDLPGWLTCLNEQLQAWRQAYEFADNALMFFACSTSGHTSVWNSCCGALRRVRPATFAANISVGCLAVSRHGSSAACRWLFFLPVRARAASHLVRRPPWMQSGKTTPARRSSRTK